MARQGHVRTLFEHDYRRTRSSLVLFPFVCVSLSSPCLPFPFVSPLITIFVAFLGLSASFGISRPGRPGRHLVALLAGALPALTPLSLSALSVSRSASLLRSLVRWFPSATVIGLCMAWVLWQAGLAGIRVARPPTQALDQQRPTEYPHPCPRPKTGTSWIWLTPVAGTSFLSWNPRPLALAPQPLLDPPPPPVPPANP